VTVVELLARVEDELVRSLDLRPVTIEANLASARGSWKGTAVELKARGYEGGRVRFARFIELQGGELSIANASCLPRFEVPLPIFGLDIVAAGHGGVMVAADLSPTIAAALPRLPPHALPPAGALPEWCRRWFSPQAVYTRLPLERLAEASEPVIARARALSGLRVAPEPHRSAEIASTQRAYCRAHLEEDKGLGMLARMFGDAWAHRFLSEVMFPS
jgi:phycocyanobilin:ferredoxin oxidoreductase